MILRLSVRTRVLPDVSSQVDLNLTLLPQKKPGFCQVFFLREKPLGLRNVTNDTNFSWGYEIGLEER